MQMGVYPIKEKKKWYTYNVWFIIKNNKDMIEIHI